MNPAEDIFDVVNEHDEIIDQQPRSLVHSQGLRPVSYTHLTLPTIYSV